jgi:2-dehydro-3-deoxy-D-gluconate 5-dehydrogenase
LISINQEGLTDLVQQAVDHFGHVDILVNNAGIIRREDSLNFSEKDWDDVMNINVKTVFFFSQAVANQFVKQGHGGKDHQYCIHAILSRGHSCAFLYSI